VSRNTWRCTRCNRPRQKSESPAGYIGTRKAPLCRRCVKELAAAAEK
jgi:hypothetical protein